MKILIVEDEAAIAGVVAQGLRQAQYLVEVAEDGQEGLRRALEERFSLILLDLMLPGLDGLEVCRRLREQRRTMPILMLTARDAVADRVHGLEMGADDYLPKPFDFSELLARVGALLRRDRVNKARQIRIADVEIDTLRRRVTRAGEDVALTPREYALLEALAGREGHVLTREIIQEQVWMDDDSYSNTVDVYIGALRKKIDSGREQRLIQTVHGRGYRLGAPEAGQ